MARYCENRRTGITVDESSSVMRFYGKCADYGNERVIEANHMMRVFGFKATCCDPAYDERMPGHVLEEHGIEPILSSTRPKDGTLLGRLILLDNPKLATAESPDELRVWSNVYRTSKLGLESRYSLEDWRTTQRAFGGRCVYCGSVPLQLEIEHFIPVRLGGGTTISNIVPACHDCNAIKRSSHPYDLLPERVYASIAGKLLELESGKAKA